MAELGIMLIKIASLWLLVSLVSGLLCAAVYEHFARLIASCAPGTRAAARLGFGLVPPVSAVVIVVLVLFPGVAGVLVPTHCHAGVCGSHTPVYAASAAAVTLVAACSFLMLALMVMLGMGLRRARRRLGALRALTRPAGNAGYHLVETNIVLAWCGGLWRPSILLSRGLVERLDSTQLAAVLAHERAHVERLDNLRGLLLQLATLAWPPGPRGAIRRGLATDSEQACDLQAARAVGDPQLVIDALAVLDRQPASPAGSMAFGNGDTTLRAALLAAGPVAWAHPARAWLAVLAQWLLLIVLLTGLTHLAVEWVATLAM